MMLYMHLHIETHDPIGEDKFLKEARSFHPQDVSAGRALWCVLTIMGHILATLSASMCSLWFIDMARLPSHLWAPLQGPRVMPHGSASATLRSCIYSKGAMKTMRRFKQVRRPF